MTEPTPRFSVCTPGEPPVEVFATNSRQEALAVATTAEVVYDWTIGKEITE